MSEEKPMPSAPVGVTDPDQIAAAEERWAQCPLRDCKRDNELLYEDFYLRDIRSNRLMCSACAVRVEMGYMAREVARASEDRFFQGNQLDNAIVFGVMAGAGVLTAIAAFLLPFFYFTFIIGGAIGAGAATLARRLSGRRVTRQTQYVGIAGVVAGAIGAMIAYSVFTGIPFEFILQGLFIDVAAGIAGLLAAAWGVLLRRI